MCGGLPAVLQKLANLAVLLCRQASQHILEIRFMLISPSCALGQNQ